MKLKLLIVISIFFILVGCGGNGVSSSASETTQYSAGVTIGDNGMFCLNPTDTAQPQGSSQTIVAGNSYSCPALSPMSYYYQIYSSAYTSGIINLSGSISKVDSNTYSISGQSGKIFLYDNYAILTLKIDPQDKYKTFANYFKQHPNITHAFYAPIVALKYNSLLTSSADITASSTWLEFRNVEWYTSTIADSTTYSAGIGRGKITVLSNSVFKVRYCTNDGDSNHNPQLQDANCTDNIAKTITFTLNPYSRCWDVTPKAEYPQSEFKSACFVKDGYGSSQQIFGYLDTGSTYNNITLNGNVARYGSAGFSMISISKANTPLLISQNPYGKTSATFTSYQLCLIDANCAETDLDWGIFTNTNMPYGQSAPNPNIINQGTDCDEYDYFNSPSPGFYAGIFQGTGCSSPSMMRGDGAGFAFGNYVDTTTGKVGSLSALVTYDPLYNSRNPNSPPAIKFGINSLVTN